METFDGAVLAVDLVRGVTADGAVRTGTEAHLDRQVEGVGLRVVAGTGVQRDTGEEVDAVVARAGVRHDARHAGPHLGDPERGHGDLAVADLSDRERLVGRVGGSRAVA